MCLPIQKGIAGELVCKVNGSLIWHPVYFHEQNQFKGVMLDILKSAETPLSVKFELGPQAAWTRIIKELESGEIDIIAGGYLTDERKQKFALSVGVFENHIHIFVNRNSKMVFNSMHDLIGKRGARQHFGSYGQEFDDFSDKHLTIQRVKDMPTMFNMLLNNRADYVAMTETDGLLLLREAKYREKIKMFAQPAVRNKVYFMFNKQSPCAGILPKLNNFVQKLQKEGIIDQWKRKYMDTEHAPEWAI